MAAPAGQASLQSDQNGTGSSAPTAGALRGRHVRESSHAGPLPTLMGNPTVSKAAAMTASAAQQSLQPSPVNATHSALSSSEDLKNRHARGLSFAGRLPGSHNAGPLPLLRKRAGLGAESPAKPSPEVMVAFETVQQKSWTRVPTSQQTSYKIAMSGIPYNLANLEPFHTYGTIIEHSAALVVYWVAAHHPAFGSGSYILQCDNKEELESVVRTLEGLQMHCVELPLAK